MVDSIQRFHFAKLERVHSLQAGHVVTVLVRMRSTLMMRVDATDRTEVVFRGLGIELIQGENLRALQNCETGQWN